MALASIEVEWRVMVYTCFSLFPIMVRSLDIDLGYSIADLFKTHAHPIALLYCY
jgi:hypothetical protein